MLSYDEFLRELRYALNHLYEPEILRLSPLQSLLPLENERRARIPLGTFLVNAIEALKPALTTPRDAYSWHVYEFLYYRYVQGANQADLARQFSCSVREIRRQQSRALMFLAESLLVQIEDTAVGKPEARLEASTKPIHRDATPLEDEYGALLAHHQGRSTEVTTEVLAITDVLQPLLLQYEVELHLAEPEQWFLTSVPDVAVRQIFVSLFATVVRWAARGEIAVDYWRVNEGQVDERIQVKITLCRHSGATGRLDAATDFHEAAALLALSGGELRWQQLNEQKGILEVYMPAVGLLTVLAVDDNADILQLLTRYTNGTRYDVLPCSEPTNAVKLALDHNPAVITLDVMMAGADGWQLIRELRQNRRTAHIPILICSVLAQEAVAESLGVQAYLRKPVSRDDYLQALDFLASGKATGFRLAPQ